MKELTAPYRRVSTDEVDVIVAVKHEIKSSGKLYNALTCFPGFVFFLPQFVRLRWDWDVTTTIELWRGTTGERIGKVITRADRYHMAFTSASYNSFAHAGWGALLLTPFAGFPLVTGVVSIFASPNEGEHEPDFARSAAGRAHADRTAAVILQAISRDQTETVSEWREPTRPKLEELSKTKATPAD